MFSDDFLINSAKYLDISDRERVESVVALLFLLIALLLTAVLTAAFSYYTAIARGTLVGNRPTAVRETVVQNEETVVQNGATVVQNEETVVQNG